MLLRTASAGWLLGLLSPEIISQGMRRLLSVCVAIGPAFFGRNPPERPQVYGLEAGIGPWSI